MAFENGTSGMQPIGTFDEPNEGQVIDCSGEKKVGEFHYQNSNKNKGFRVHVPFNVIRMPLHTPALLPRHRW